METNEEAEQQINQLSLLQQNLELYLMQKQQFEGQKLEIEGAIAELAKAEESYKIIGNIMVTAKPDELKKELEEKLESITLRIKSIEKQEEKLKHKANELQQDVLSKMKK
jgi:prefoldin beta subunit